MTEGEFRKRFAEDRLAGEDTLVGDGDERVGFATGLNGNRITLHDGSEMDLSKARFLPGLAPWG